MVPVLLYVPGYVHCMYRRYETLADTISLSMSGWGLGVGVTRVRVRL